MTSDRKAIGWRSRSVLKVIRPEEEQLAHFRVIRRTWTSFGSIPILSAHRYTSSFKVAVGTVSSICWAMSSAPALSP